MAHPYDVWSTRRLLGVMRDVKEEASYWLPMFGGQINFDTEWVDFEKLPINRKMAAFVRPLGQGRPVYTDRTTVFRFKPAYIKVKDIVDPIRPLTALPGIDTGILDQEKMSPEQRVNLLRAAIVRAHLYAIQRRWEWMACQAITNASITISGEEYPTTTLDFQRAGNHTVTLGVGQRWGDSGVSIFDSIQTFADRMFDAPFGGFPTRLTITPAVWAVMRKDAEILKHMETDIREPRATVERGLIDSGVVVPVGSLTVGGSSGARIEIVLYRDTYVNDAGSEVPFLTNGQVIFTSSPERIMGYRCFGAIVDRMANYQSVPIFPRNWLDDKSDPVVETILHQSAPLMVPVNPNATLKLTAVAV